MKSQSRLRRLRAAYLEVLVVCLLDLIRVKVVYFLLMMSEGYKNVSGKFAKRDTNEIP